MVVLPGQDHETQVNIPAQYLGEILSPRRVNVPTSLTDLLPAALLHPIGCRPLAELATPGRKILIIVDDHTRTTPPWLTWRTACSMFPVVSLRM